MLRRVLRPDAGSAKILLCDQLANEVEEADGRPKTRKVDGPNKEGSCMQIKKFRHFPLKAMKNHWRDLSKM